MKSKGLGPIKLDATKGEEHGDKISGTREEIKNLGGNIAGYGNALLTSLIGRQPNEERIDSYKDLISYNFGHDRFFDVLRTPTILTATWLINNMIMSKYDTDINENMEISDFARRYGMLLGLNLTAIVFVREKIFDYVGIIKDIADKKLAKAQAKLKWDISTDVLAGLGLLYANYTQSMIALGGVLLFWGATEYVEGKRFPEDGGMLSKLKGMGFDKIAVMTFIVRTSLIAFNTKIDLHNMAKYFGECEKSEIDKTKFIDGKERVSKIYRIFRDGKIVSISESILTVTKQYMYIITTKTKEGEKELWYVYTNSSDNTDYTAQDILDALNAGRFSIFKVKHPEGKVPENKRPVVFELDSNLYY